MNLPNEAEHESRLETVSAVDLLCRNQRFDLIIKLRYAQNILNGEISDYAKRLYLENIGSFNNFREDYPKKNGPDDFVTAFREIIESIRTKGFDQRFGAIPVDANHQMLNGGHRVAACAAMSKDVVIQTKCIGSPEIFDYQFFQRQGMSHIYSDQAALDYVRFNKKSTIFTLHSMNDTKSDEEVELILRDLGFIYYKKSCHLNFNGYVNIKKISYPGAKFIGTPSDAFRGAREHAALSYGRFPLRTYVFVGRSPDAAGEAKKLIRKRLGGTNETVHTTDTHEEAVALAEALLNTNSIYFLNARDSAFHSSGLDENLKALRETLRRQNIETGSICIAGSAPLGAFGIRPADSIDFHALEKVQVQPELSDRVSQIETELRLYPASVADLISDPRMHFFYNGFKFATLDVVSENKKRRAHNASDDEDVKLIARFRRKNIGPAVFNAFDYLMSFRSWRIRLRNRIHRYRKRFRR